MGDRSRRPFQAYTMTTDLQTPFYAAVIMVTVARSTLRRSCANDCLARRWSAILTGAFVQSVHCRRAQRAFSRFAMPRARATGSPAARLRSSSCRKASAPDPMTTARSSRSMTCARLSSTSSKRCCPAQPAHSIPPPAFTRVRASAHASSETHALSSPRTYVRLPRDALAHGNRRRREDRKPGLREPRRRRCSAHVAFRRNGNCRTCNDRERGVARHRSRRRRQRRSAMHRDRERLATAVA